MIFHYFGLEVDPKSLDVLDLGKINNLFSSIESKIPCVLISGVYSRNQVETINKYVDYVIGMDLQKVDDEMIAFCRGFYSAFGSGESIEEAFAVGGNEILVEAGKSFEGLSVPPVSLKPVLYRRSFDLKPLNIATAKISFKENPMRVFETITVDAAGQTNKTETIENYYFEEKLGEDIEPLTMMAIPEGEFMMGSPEDEKERHDDESPQHQVKVTPFWLAQTPVTFAQWNFVVNNLAQEKRGLNPKESKDKDEHPVTEVSWYDAIEFCARLTRHTGRNYRLPSEAEWEYAARAGTTTPFHFGETITGELANYDASATYANETAGEWKNQTISVKNFKPNAFGLYDIHGQVFEWCADPWHDSYEEAPQERDSSVWDEEKENDNFYRNILDNLPKLLKDERSRILRGGSYYDNPRNCRSAYRNRNNPVIDSTFYGFRLAVSDPRTL